MLRDQGRMAVMDEIPTGIHGARRATLIDIARALERYDEHHRDKEFIADVRAILEAHKVLTAGESEAI